LQGILDITSLLVCLFVEVATDVSLLFLNLANQCLSETFTHNIDKALQILSTDVLTDNTIPSLEAIKPLLRDIKVSKLRLQVFIKAHLSELVDFSACLNF